jgi:hypothetical protein
MLKRRDHGPPPVKRVRPILRFETLRARNDSISNALAAADDPHYDILETIYLFEQIFGCGLPDRFRAFAAGVESKVRVRRAS